MVGQRPLKVGDTVRRLLAESIPSDIVIIAIDDEFIYCIPPGSGWSKEMGWKFNKRGLEVDEDLDWDGVTRTGSRLIGRVK